MLLARGEQGAFENTHSALFLTTFASGEANVPGALSEPNPPGRLGTPNSTPLGYLIHT